jgi:peptide/nickel transport system permease protein
MATTLELPLIDVLPEKPTGPSAWATNVGRFCRRKPLGAVGGFIVLLMLICALFVDTALIGGDTPLLALEGYNDQHIRRADRNIGAFETMSHPLGTDDLGRDIFSRILYGARIAAVIGFSAVALSAAVSLVLGTVSGYFGGWVDTIIQRVIDVILAIPAIVLLIFALAVFATRAGPYKTMLWITLIIGFILAAASVRVIRSAALSTAANQYIDAARTIGATNSRIILRHMVPNVVPVAIVFATVQLGTTILAAASVSVLGLGIPQPFPDWGVMLSLTGAVQFRVNPEQAIWPGLAIALAVYGFNMFGDALRDVLDPRLRGGR